MNTDEILRKISQNLNLKWRPFFPVKTQKNAQRTPHHPIRPRWCQRLRAGNCLHGQVLPAPPPSRWLLVGGWDRWKTLCLWPWTSRFATWDMGVGSGESDGASKTVENHRPIGLCSGFDGIYVLSYIICLITLKSNTCSNKFNQHQTCLNSRKACRQ